MWKYIEEESLAQNVSPDTAFYSPSILSTAFAYNDVVTVTPVNAFVAFNYKVILEVSDAVKVPPLIVFLEP